MKKALLIVILVIIFMSLFSFFKKDPSVTPSKDSSESNFIILTITPGVEPAERESKYGNPINTLLQEKTVGEVTGGGTMLGEPDKDNKQTFEFSDIEIEMTSHSKDGLKILLNGLRENNFPENTEIMLWDSPQTKFSNITSFNNYLETI